MTYVILYKGAQKQNKLLKDNGVAVLDEVVGEVTFEWKLE